jgi:hypothetical protein
VLEVRIPKPEQRKPRRVEISTGSAELNGGAPAVEGTASEAAPRVPGPAEAPA